jgi:hypothetical protein
MIIRKFDGKHGLVVRTLTLPMQQFGEKVDKQSF